MGPPGSVLTVTTLPVSESRAVVPINCSLTGENTGTYDRKIRNSRILFSPWPVLRASRIITTHHSSHINGQEEANHGAGCAGELRCVSTAWRWVIVRALECRKAAELTPGEGAATVQRLISSHHITLAQPYAHAVTERPCSCRTRHRVWVYQSIVDGRSPRSLQRHPSTPCVAATVETGSNPA